MNAYFASNFAVRTTPSWSFSVAWVLLGVAVLLQGATAQQPEAGPNITNLISALESKGFKQLAGLFDTIQLKDRDIPSNINITLLAPTDQAIQDFASSMGLSVAELRDRPALVDTLLTYHVIPRKLTGEGLQAGGAPRTAKPLSSMGNAKDVLRFQRLANGTIIVTDVQNNTAQVTDKPIMLPRANIFPVNRMLLNGDVFNNVTKLLEFHPEFSSLAALVTKAPKVAGTLRENVYNYTLLAPTNDALAAASSSLPSDEQGLARVLRHHVISRPGALPDDFRPGAPLTTLLPGHDVTLRYTRVTVPAQFNSSRNVSFTTITVLPEGGSPGAAANVTSANIFAGRGTVQGIDRVLLPAKEASNTSNTAAAAADTTSSSPAPSTGRRTLLSTLPAAHTSTTGMHLLEADVWEGSMNMLVRGRQVLRSNRASGFGGRSGSNGCDRTLNDGCGVRGTTSSVMWQSLQDTSDRTRRGSAVDAGDVF